MGRSLYLGVFVTSSEAARQVVASVVTRNIEIAEAGAMRARYQDMLNAAELLDEQAALWRSLLEMVSGAE